jgi:hypothetical protein
MYKSIRIAAAAVLLAASAGIANAGPANVGQAGDGIRANDLLLQVEGPRGRRFDRSCRRGPGGWYRYNRFGERRPCRNWDGRGRRPDACVKFGPAWFCDY